MNIKLDLIGKLIITYIFLLSLCFLIYGLVVLPTNGAEKVNAIIGLLSWSATIYAPIAAYLLLDNWKDQKAYELKKEYIAIVLHDLRSIFTKFLQVCSNTGNIFSVNEDLVINTKYLDYNSLELGTQATNLYGNIKVFSTISNDPVILELYDEFEQHIFFIDEVYKQLIKHYNNYYFGFTKTRSYDQNSEYDIFREYLGSERDTVENFIIVIQKFSDKQHCYARQIDSNTNLRVYKYTINQLLKNTLEMHNRIQSMCLKDLKP